MRSAPQTPTFDAFGEPIAALSVLDRAGPVRTLGAVAFWVVAALLVAGRIYLAVPPFEQAAAATHAPTTTLALAQDAALR